MHTPYTPSQRQPGGQTCGQTYIPPPPPPPPQPVPPQTHGIALPPPPPRTPASNPRTPGGAVPPWAGSWPRQMNYPPPPPPPGQAPVAAYNPAQYYSYQASAHHPSGSIHSQPLTTATFVPGPLSWGIGVGIPGYEEYRASSNYEPATRDDSYNITVPYEHGPPSPNATRDESNSATQIRPAASPHFSTTSHRPSAPVDAQAALAAQWTLEHILALLKNNGFSTEWQETFRELDLHGTKFLDLGKHNAGKGPSLMYSTINPKLCEISKSRNNTFDQTSAREEGKRLRKLVRGIVSIGGVPTVSPHIRQRGSTIDQSSTPSTAGDGDSPGKQMPPGTSPRVHSLSQPRVPKPSPFAPPEDGGTEMVRSRSAFTESTLKALESTLSNRHSPNGSVEVSNHSPTTTEPRTASSRTTLDNSPQQASAKPNSMSGRYYNNTHHRVTSSDQNLNFQLNSIPGLSDPTRMSFNGPASRSQDRRRPSFAEPHGRNNSVEGAQHGKEHRNIVSKLMNRKRKDEPATTFDEMNLPSPSSPSAMRSIFGASNPSDTSLTRPKSGQERMSGHGRLHSKSDASRKYVMITPDGSNYRLLNVTGVEQPDVFRNIVRQQLQMPAEIADLPCFMTSPGQIEHHESLSDIQISQCLLGADAQATLKLFVRTPFSPMPAPPPDFLPQIAPSPHVPVGLFGRPVDEDTLRLLSAELEAGNDQQDDKEKPYQSLQEGATINKDDRERDLKQKMEEYRRDVERKQRDYHERRRSRINTTGRMDVIDFDKRRDSLTDEKRDSLVPLRQPPPAPADSNTLLKANSLRKNATPPMRRSASERSDGSSSHRSWEFIDNAEDKKTLQPPDSSIAGALASMGTMPAALGAPRSTPDRSQPSSRPTSSRCGKHTPKDSPRSPGYTMSKGNVPFRIPDYDAQNRVSMSPDEAAAAMVSFKDENEMTNAVRKSIYITSPQASPPTKRPTSLYRSSTVSSRKSYGPSHDFKEHRVSFESRRASAQPNSGSDSDSDGGLFAVPIVSDKPKKNKADTDSDSQSSAFGTRRTRPSLSLRTHSPRGQKVVSFGGESRTTDDDDTPRGEGPPSVNHSNGNIAPEPGPTSAYTPESPDETTKDFRRRSFFSDVWADRPAPETVAERLDEFFPNVDLDQPMLDPESSPPASPGLTRKPAQKKSHDSLRTTYPLSSTDDSDEAHDSDSRPSVSHHHTKPSVAQRNIRRSGDIGRTKSIRDVVKSVYIPSYEAPPIPASIGHAHQHSVHTAAPAHGIKHGRDSLPAASNRISTLKKNENMIRRRSTKMFGARIEQIKPQRGSRILHGLETIPQDMPMPAQDNISTLPTSSSSSIKRQPTFKWLKGQLIGKGTFGKVYLGFNTTTAELMAVKQVEVDPRRAGGEKDKIKEMVKALDQEIDTMQNLEHENIVAYLGCEREELKISIFLEYIDGGSIGSCLRKHGKFEEPVVSSLTRQSLQGLAYLHESGILHRDLKADNILLTSDGICKISDFGISKKTDNIYGDDAQNTMQGSVFWMAPEVVRSQGAGYSAKVDIWSLGCVVLEMFAGRRPWAKDEAVGAIYKLGTLNQAPPIPDDVSKSISPSAIGFMLDCFTIDPRDRPTAGTLLEHEFCRGWQNFSFFDSDLYQKIKPQTRD